MRRGRERGRKEGGKRESGGEREEGGVMREYGHEVGGDRGRDIDLTVIMRITDR